MSACSLVSSIGRITSMTFALRPVTWLMAHSLYAILNSRTAWCQRVVLSLKAVAEFKFWLHEITKFNGQRID